MRKKVTGQKTGKTSCEAVGLKGKVGFHNQINEVALIREIDCSTVSLRRAMLSSSTIWGTVTYHEVTLNRRIMGHVRSFNEERRKETFFILKKGGNSYED